MCKCTNKIIKRILSRYYSCYKHTIYMLRKIFITSILCLCFFVSNAQKEIYEAYAVLNLRSSARVAALGMYFLPWQANDISVSITNPSLLSIINNNQFSVGYIDLFSGIWQGNLAYSHTFDKLGSFSFGLNYINYGNFTRTEANGDVSGSFTANDYMFTVGWGRMLDSNVYIGANFKPIISQYESYSSVALAFDIAATYMSSDRSFTATFMARNFGTQLKAYNNTEEKLPFQLEAGISKKLKHAPFRLYLMATNLQVWDLREDDPLNPRDEIDPFTGVVKKENSFLGFLDNSFRHLNFGVDFEPSKNFRLSFGYSWKQSREMYLEDAFSMAGFSYGFGFNIKKFQISYSRNEYHKYGSPNNLTLLVRL